MGKDFLLYYLLYESAATDKRLEDFNESHNSVDESQQVKALFGEAFLLHYLLYESVATDKQLEDFNESHNSLHESSYKVNIKKVNGRCGSFSSDSPDWLFELISAHSYKTFFHGNIPFCTISWSV